MVDLTDNLMRFYLDNLNKYTPEQLASMHFDFVLQATQSILKLRDGWILAPASILEQHTK